MKPFVAALAAAGLLALAAAPARADTESAKLAKYQARVDRSVDSERCRRSGNFILSMTKGKDLIDDGRQRTYAIYYCAQAMHQLGGKYWEQFGERLYQYLLRTQGKSGSWAVKGEGEVYPTAMFALALSVPYCQLPIYQR